MQVFFPCTLCESWHSVNNVEGVGSRREAGGGRWNKSEGRSPAGVSEQVGGLADLHTQPGSGLEGRPALAGLKNLLGWQVAGACCLLSRCLWLAVSAGAPVVG